METFHQLNTIANQFGHGRLQVEDESFVTSISEQSIDSNLLNDIDNELPVVHS